jgi:hypothetical protein
LRIRMDTVIVSLCDYKQQVYLLEVEKRNHEPPNRPNLNGPRKGVHSTIELIERLMKCNIKHPITIQS